MFEELRDALHRLEAAGESELDSVKTHAEALLDRIKQHILRDPEPLFAILRRVKPILLIKNYALVTRFEDVREVLALDQIFQVTYGEKMRVVTGGRDFFLGMQNSPEYERDTAHMRSCMRREDLPRIAAFLAQTANDSVEAARGSIDVVALSHAVTAGWLASYFGCPAASEGGASEEGVASWATTIFQYLFADLNNDPALARAAGDASAHVRDWLDSVIARRKAAPAPADDVLNRCLALQRAGLPAMDDIGIRDNLLGLIAGAIPTTSKCAAQALDQLLDRPDQLAAAQQAARAGDDQLLAQYVFEALRFNPNNPALFRVPAEDFMLARNSLHATLIPKGTIVAAATQSAMFDADFVEAPNEFRIGRPDYASMHFGYGLHTCFGQYLNRIQIPAILKPLLQRNGLAREGDLEYTGPFPSSLRVSFG